MAKPHGAPTTPKIELPTFEEIRGPQVAPFAVAQQFDAMVSQGNGLASFAMPQRQPKPIEYGGNLPGPAYAPGAPPAKPTRGVMQGKAAAKAPAKAAPPAPSSWGNQDWGSKTAQFQAMFPGLRHTGGYRSPEKNARTPGAAKNSLHMQRDANGHSRANDYVGSPAEMQRAAAWLKANGARECLIHNAGTGTHLHVAW